MINELSVALRPLDPLFRRELNIALGNAVADWGEKPGKDGRFKLYKPRTRYSGRAAAQSDVTPFNLWTPHLIGVTEEDCELVLDKNRQKVNLVRKGTRQIERQAAFADIWVLNPQETYESVKAFAGGYVLRDRSFQFGKYTCTAEELAEILQKAEQEGNKPRVLRNMHYARVPTDLIGQEFRQISIGSVTHAYSQKDIVILDSNGNMIPRLVTDPLRMDRWIPRNPATG